MTKSTHHMSSIVLKVVFAAMVLIGPGKSLEGVTGTWLGGSSSNDMNQGANWVEGFLPPITGNAIFDATGAGQNPALVNPSETFMINELSFSSTNYTFNFQGNAGALVFGGDSTAVGVNSPSTAVVDFNVSNLSTVNFEFNSSANLTGSSNITYNVEDGFIVFDAFGTTGNTANAGDNTVFQIGGPLNEGQIVFNSSSSADSSSLFVGNANGPGSASFFDASSAGTAVINIGDTTIGSVVRFNGDSNTVFSTAANATISVGYNLGAATTSGDLEFLEFSTAGSANISVGNSHGDTGTLNFLNSSTAGNANISIGSSAGTSEVGFLDSTSGGNSTIQVGNANGKGSGSFNQSSTLGAAVMTVGTDAGSGAVGAVDFFNSSNAGTSTVTPAQINIGDPTGGSTVQFFADSSSTFTSAGTALIQVGDSSGSGILNFLDFSTADAAVITVGDATGNSSVNFFSDSNTAFSTAGVAQIQLGFNGNGTGNFNGFSTAAEASIIVGSALGVGELNFNDFSNAGLNTLLTASLASGGIQVGDSTGNSSVNFFDNSSAGTASIFIGDLNGDGRGNFNNSSTAANAIITVGYALSAGTIGTLDFNDTSSAGSAAITVQNFGSTVNFNDSSTATTASVDLINQGQMNLNEDLSLGSLSSDSTGVANLNSFELTLNETNTATVAGVIEGVGGSLDMAGTGTVILTGPNTYTGLTTVSNGTLQVNTTSLPGNADISSVGASLVFNQTANGTYSHLLTGIGNVVKEGNAGLNLTADNSAFAGTTAVNAGNLVLSNNLGGNVVAQVLGILSGTGTILGNLTVNNGGIVSPGNLSTGTLTVNGNYTQNTGGTFMAVIDGLGNSNFLEVGGIASLNGTLAIAAVGNQLEFGHEYHIINAVGGVNGQFQNLTIDNVSGSSDVLKLNVVYDPNDVFFDILVQFNSIVGLTFNEEQVALQIDSTTNPSPALLSLITSLSALSTPDIQTALNQMTGEQYTNALLATEFVNRQFIRRLYDPLRSIINASPCCNMESCECCGLDLDFWAEAGGSKTHVKGNRNAAGFDMKGFEVTIGAQTYLGDCWTFGVAGGYEMDHVKYKLSGRGKNHTGLVGAYTLFRPNCFYFLADAAYGYSSNKVKRIINVGTTFFEPRTTQKMSQSTFYTEAGLDFTQDCLLIQPFAGVEIAHFKSNRFCEHGGGVFNLGVRKREKTSAHSRLGVHLAAPDTGTGISLNVDLAWQYRLTTSQNFIYEQFQTFGEKFAIRGVRLPRSSFDGIAFVSKRVNEHFEVFAEFEGGVWDKAYTYSAGGGVKLAW